MTKKFWENFGRQLDQAISDAEPEAETKKKSSRPLKWEEFIKKTGEDLDKRLIEHAKKEGLVYVGGKCRFTATKAERNKSKFVLNVDAELFFKDQFRAEKNFQIYPLHTERFFDDFALDDEETNDQLETLKTEQYEFNVETPQIEKKEG